jgi:hypothetical protein
MKVLFAVPIFAEDWMEELITDVEDRIPLAAEWARANGFDRLRVADIDDSLPDFAGTLNI